MKIKFEKKRISLPVRFSDIEIGKTFVYEWSPDDVRVKVSYDQYFSFVTNKLVQCSETSRSLFRVKADLIVFTG